MKYWTMTDFEGNGYINDCHGNTIIKTDDYATAQQVCDDLNRNSSIDSNYKPELTKVKTILKEKTYHINNFRSNEHGTD